MRLTIRDGVATAFSGLAVLALVAAFGEWSVPLVGASYRSAAVAAFFLGTAAWLSGRPLQGYQEPVLGALGILALAAAILAIATGSPIFLVLLIADILTLWLATTVRHARQRRSAHRPIAGSFRT